MAEENENNTAPSAEEAAVENPEANNPVEMEAAEEPSEEPSVQLTEDEKKLQEKIKKQVEYYFGDYNLPRDKFLSDKIKEDEEEWVLLSVIMTFTRMSDLSTNSNVILKSLEGSTLIEISADESKIRRSRAKPAPEMDSNLRDETIKRTVYCKGFPRDGSIKLDFLLEFFSPHGPFETVHMRNFHDKATNKHGFKGSVLVVFPTVDQAKVFMAKEDIQHKKLPILRKWHAHYLEEKQNEFEERKARKEARKEQLQKEDDLTINNMQPLPKGTFLFSSGYTNTTAREDIKKAVLDLIDDIAFIDFKKGDTEAYMRLAAPNSNKIALEALKDKLKVNDADIEVRLVEGEEEDKEMKKAQEAKARCAGGQGGQKRKRAGGRGGGGGRGRGGHSFKRRRNN